MYIYRYTHFQNALYVCMVLFPYEHVHTYTPTKMWYYPLCCINIKLQFLSKNKETTCDQKSLPKKNEKNICIIQFL